MTVSPIRVSEHVYALPLETSVFGGPTLLNVALMLDGARGATLVDTGIPGMQDAILEGLQAVGLGWGDIRRVIVTHHDIDHIGSLPAVVAATGAEVLTSEGETPYVQGDRPAQKQPPREQADRRPPALHAAFAAPVHAPVVRALQDNETLDIAGGVRVVLTPGHTVGHLSLFVVHDGVLITGDALSSDDGRLRAPVERMTADMPEALRSVQKLAQLPVEKILTFHGGVVDQDAAAQLRRVADTAQP